MIDLKFEKKLEFLGGLSDKELSMFAFAYNRLIDDLETDVIASTPVKTGTLQRGFKIGGSFNKKTLVAKAYVKNNVRYAIYIDEVQFIATLPFLEFKFEVESLVLEYL